MSSTKDILSNIPKTLSKFPELDAQWVALESHDSDKCLFIIGKEELVFEKHKHPSQDEMVYIKQGFCVVTTYKDDGSVHELSELKIGRQYFVSKGVMHSIVFSPGTILELEWKPSNNIVQFAKNMESKHITRDSLFDINKNIRTFFNNTKAIETSFRKLGGAIVETIGVRESTTGQNHIFTYVDDTFAKWFGKPPEFFVGNSYLPHIKSREEEIDFILQNKKTPVTGVTTDYCIDGIFCSLIWQTIEFNDINDKFTSAVFLKKRWKDE